MIGAAIRSGTSHSQVLTWLVSSEIPGEPFIFCWTS